MPSPFPGMDPYLENPSLWPDVHASLITYTREALQSQVRPTYVARIGERIELAALRRAYVPDVLMVQSGQPERAQHRPSGLAVADTPQTFTLLDEARRVPYIEIVHRESGDVVTLIEVLSPTNKQGEGREQYLQKQMDLLATEVNLVEIDLLGGGRPTVLARSVPIQQPANWRYVVSVSRGNQRNQIEVYAVALADRLPRCRIPLRPPDADVVLDLPAVFDRCYDVGGYDLLIDYNCPPDVPLRDEEQVWVQEWLAKKPETEFSEGQTREK